MQNPSANLIARAKELETSRFGISLDAIGRLNWDEAICSEMVQCLESDSALEIGWGLFFSRAFLAVNKLPSEFVVILIQKLNVLRHHKEYSVRSSVAACLVCLGKDVKDHRDWLLVLLKDESPSVRQVALEAAQAFLGVGDIELLLSFRHDTYVFETTMYGPLRFILRDMALAQIELILNHGFHKSEMTELHNGEPVFWWDWSPFLEWHQRSIKKSFWRFWSK